MSTFPFPIGSISAPHSFYLHVGLFHCFMFFFFSSFFHLNALPRAEPYAVWGRREGVYRLTRSEGKGDGRNCAGRKDVLVAAASDSISMNFSAKAVAAAAAAASSGCLSQPAAALCVEAPLERPVAASHLLLTPESSA